MIQPVNASALPFTHLTGPSRSWSEAASQLKAAEADNHSPEAKASDEELRTVFRQFVGEAFYGQLLQSMRKTVGKPAYFHGGRGEEVFQAQLDQQLAQQMAEATGDTIADPMFELFQLPRAA